MPSITQVILVTRALTHVLDKHFNAQGRGLREKVQSAKAELGPDLTRDLTALAATEEAATRDLRPRKPEAAAVERATPPPAEETASSGPNWTLIAITLLFAIFALSMGSEP